MLKLIRAFTATGLGLAMGLSLLTSGASAQSVSQNAIQAATQTVGIHSTDGKWQNGNFHNNIPHWNNHGWNNHGWNNRGWNNRGWNNHGWGNHGWDNRGHDNH